MEFSLGEIAHLLGGEVEGDHQAKVNTVARIQEGKPGSISFLANEKYEPYIYSTDSTAVLVSRSFAPRKGLKTSLIRVDDPYVSLSVLLQAYERMTRLDKQGREAPCFVAESAKLGEGHYVGAFAYIGEGAVIGNQVKIYPQAYIGDGVIIGDHTVIYPGVKIYHGSKIGSHCTIHAGSVIGSDGFGFAPSEDGSYKTVPQVGHVEIGNHVDIGANTTVDRATLGATRIGDGVKLDNLVQIAHNVELGKNTVIAAQTGISGSTKIGAQCSIGGQVGFAGHLEIADGNQFGAQSGIGSSIKTPGQKLMGSPVLPLKDFYKSYVVYRKLPDLMRRIEKLEADLLGKA